MELTIKQALQQAVAAHKNGTRQEAERLYRAILQVEPGHPDANHNLGLIAVSVNQALTALPLFKAALKANPKVEQFWISYIDTLIKVNQVDSAKKALEDAKIQGLSGKQLNSLEAELALKMQRNKPQSSALKNDDKTLEVNSPSQLEIKNLLHLYQNGQYYDAEKLALSITKQFPDHQFSWKVLGAALKQTGRIRESLIASQKSVELAPQDALAHSNLGVTLRELGRLNEAEASYAKAIELKPGYADAHNNLGNTLQELGKLEEAEASYKKAIALKPDLAEAHSNLGNTFKELQRLAEAEVSLRRAIAIKPNHAEAHSNLGITLQRLGRLAEAKESYIQSIALNADYAEARNNLGVTLKELGKLNEAEATYIKAIALKPDYAEAHGNLGVALQELGRLDEAEESYAKAIALKPTLSSFRYHLLLCLYLLDKESLFYEQLDHLIDDNKADAAIGSLTCRSELKYGVERPNLFCKKPLDYVLHTDLSAQYDFENVFAAKARSILDKNKISGRKQSLLTNGYQTSGNLFAIENSLTGEIQKAILLEIEKYRKRFKRSEEGFIKNWPSEYNLYGWLISMKTGGKLEPHIHDQGWVSGSVYINVPPKLKADSGNLVVSLGQEEDVRCGRINVKNTINVVTGSIVLFPGSLTHYTIPFESEDDRIVLAFDVREK